MKGHKSHNTTYNMAILPPQFLTEETEKVTTCDKVESSISYFITLHLHFSKLKPLDPMIHCHKN